MSESTEQQFLIQWFYTQYPDKIIYANANAAWFGGVSARRGQAYGALRKREGLLAGVSDLFIPEPVFKYMGLFIEMKDVGCTQCSVTAKQKKFLEDMRARGYYATWSPGADHAMAVIKSYFEGEL